MLWTIIKIALFIALVAALAIAGTTLSETGEAVRLTLGGTEYVLGPVQAAVALLLIFAAVWLALKLIGLTVAFVRFLAGDSTALTRYFDRRRHARGLEALSEGMLAIASGEGKLAQAQAARAAKYLPRPEVTRLLTAQAAEAAGDTRTAYNSYKAMLADDRTRFIGVRGIMAQKLAAGETELALALAQKAYALRPRHSEVQDTLLKLETETGHWGAARKVLEDQMREGRLPKDVYRRRDAVMALQEAKGVLDDGATIEAREAAIAANRKSPDLIPAAVMAARSYIASGEAKNASRVLAKAWAAQPHPSLAAAFADIAPDETPQARIRRFETLMAGNTDHLESKLLRAELNIAAEDFPTARRVLSGVAETHPTARSLTLMAAIERGQGADEAVVRGWLTRALGASRGPQWVCDNCHNVMADWGPTCDSCGGFDTLTWREPPGRTAPVANGADMLPLIVAPSQGREPQPEAAATPVEPAKPGFVEPEPETLPKVAAAVKSHHAPPATKPGFIEDEPQARAAHRPVARSDDKPAAPKAEGASAPVAEDQTKAPARPDMADSRADRTAVKGGGDENRVEALARIAQQIE